MKPHEIVRDLIKDIKCDEWNLMVLPSLPSSEKSEYMFHFSCIRNNDSSGTIQLSEWTKLVGSADIIIPNKKWPREKWLRWIFDQIANAEIHELMEQFQYKDCEPFYPKHTLDEWMKIEFKGWDFLQPSKREKKTIYHKVMGLWPGGMVS